MTNTEIKQVIVVRRDLKMRRGKEAAQVAHAAMAFLSEAIKWAGWRGLREQEKQWMNGRFTKIVLSAESEEELTEIYSKACAAGFRTKKIIDAGLTEFKEPTFTCIAIGPDYADKIDQITGHLKLR
jgi:PTH2 family peptidyl-tRNA hydrolase